MEINAVLLPDSSTVRFSVAVNICEHEPESLIIVKIKKQQQPQIFKRNQVNASLWKWLVTLPSCESSLVGCFCWRGTTPHCNGNHNSNSNSSTGRSPTDRTTNPQPPRWRPFLFHWACVRKLTSEGRCTQRKKKKNTKHSQSVDLQELSYSWVSISKIASSNGNYAAVFENKRLICRSRTHIFPLNYFPITHLSHFLCLSYTTEFGYLWVHCKQTLQR